MAAVSAGGTPADRLRWDGAAPVGPDPTDPANPADPAPTKPDDPTSQIDPADRLPASARRWLRTRIGPTEPAPPPATRPALPVPPSALPDGARRALEEAVGNAGVRLDEAARLGHAGGMSYLDLLRRRRGEPVAVPDAVVLPADHDEVGAVLRVCADHDVAVVPFGGGTSVVGGVAALRGGHAAVLALDLARLDRLVTVDPVSLTATLQAGVRGPAVERLLDGHRLTLGHFPQSFARASIGGYAATRSAGQASGGYGRFDEMVVGLRMVTPSGDLVLGRAPSSAAGPDLRQLALGSEGAFGVITEVTLRVRPLPERTRYEAWSFQTFETGQQAVRRLAQDGMLPDVTRLSDPDETAATLALAGRRASTAAGRAYLWARGHSTPCLLVVGWEGSAANVRRRRAAGHEELRGSGAAYLTQAPGRAWVRGRFGAPHLRDRLMDAGLLVETLETAGPWSRLAELRSGVRAALERALAGEYPPLVMCHLSHAYPAGGSLYFTVVAGASTGDPVGQWEAAKRAAGDAIVAGGGTITHHHAVGVDHRPWLTAEIGEVGVEVLRAVKQRLDPQNILNPGKLLPE